MLCLKAAKVRTIRLLLFPSLQLGTGKTAAVRLSGWLVGKSCLSRVCHSVCPRAAEGRQARVCVPCDSAECIIQRRFAIRVDSVPISDAPKCKMCLLFLWLLTVVQSAQLEFNCDTSVLPLCWWLYICNFYSLVASPCYTVKRVLAWSLSIIWST